MRDPLKNEVETTKDLAEVCLCLIRGFILTDLNDIDLRRKLEGLSEALGGYKSISSFESEAKLKMGC